MSKIFDALKRAEQLVKGRPGPAPGQPERRRTARWPAHVPVFVYGHTLGAAPFHEEAYSTNVSALGARLVMLSDVLPGQTLLLTNKVTQAEQECSVAYVDTRNPQAVEVAVEFPLLSPEFWRITAVSANPVPLGRGLRRRRIRRPKTQ